MDFAAPLTNELATVCTPPCTLLADESPTPDACTDNFLTFFTLVA